jgi:hypothetical protein
MTSLNKKNAKLIDLAIAQNPLWDLAEKFLREGYTEETIQEVLIEGLFQDSIAIRLKNYMRDIVHGMKKPTLY